MVDPRDRTKGILDSYAAKRARYDDPETGDMTYADLTNLEGLMRETIRQLREHMAECVRSERRAAEAKSADAIDLNYAEAKSELDAAIQQLTAEKTRVRAAKLRPAVEVAEEDPLDDNSAEDQLMKLLELHTSGVLTADEFVAAKSRLV